MYFTGISSFKVRSVSIMDIATKSIIFGISFILVFGIGGLYLQILLSVRDSKWAGLLLPVLSFCVSLVIAINVAVAPDESSVILSTVTAFLLCNTPTTVFIAIYAACRW